MTQQSPELVVKNLLESHSEVSGDGSDPNGLPKPVIAHVLFADVVGYTNLASDEQSTLLQQLQHIVRSSGEFIRACRSERLISNPTGDGMALIFFDEPLAPLNCAFEIAAALRAEPRIKLRMGVHSGPVYRIADINGKENVAGSGINMAQRVMDCGDAGHILVSDTVADFLKEFAGWRERLHDLGEAQAKHGVLIRIFNVYTDDAGNAECPAKLQASAPPVAPPVIFAPATAVQRVAILYRRNTQPDEYVLGFLEEYLRKHGAGVFIDRHLKVGLEWAKEIEREVRTADAVIPLISEAAMSSEMLAYEVQIAHDAAQKNGGKPRLLPVRIGYEGPLPEALGAILGPLQYALWTSRESDLAVGEQLLVAMTSPLHAEPAHPRNLEPPGGAVPLDSRFYVVRATDEDFCSAISRCDSIVLVKGARQMGKTSLLSRGLQQARRTGAKVILTDFQKLNAADMASVETFYLALGSAIADQLDLDVLPGDVWKPRRGPNENFERYLRREILGKLSVPLVWGLDEVDRLFTCSFGNEVFGLFRSWHNARALDPESPWNRLTLAIAYATEAHLFITDLNQSPFNVGTRLSLHDFTIENLADLNNRYGKPLQDMAEVESFYGTVGGQPYLIRRGLHEMVTRGLSIQEFEAQACGEEGPFGDHLRRYLVLLSRDRLLLDAVGRMLRGEGCTDAVAFHRLRSAGILAGESVDQARFRCCMYQRFLGRHLA